MYPTLSVLKWVRTSGFATACVVVTAMLSTLLSTDAAPAPAAQGAATRPPERLVVLTFDDSVASHATVVAPLLKKFGFGATFFITEGFDFVTNKTQYMTWGQIRGLHDAGFEIGNHTRHHTGVNGQNAAQIEADVAYIEQQCAAHGIPRPTSFCYPGYASSAVAVQVLRGRGYRFARAGGAQAFDPAKDEPLGIGDDGAQGSLRSSGRTSVGGRRSQAEPG